MLLRHSDAGIDTHLFMPSSMHMRRYLRRGYEQHSYTHGGWMRHVRLYSRCSRAYVQVYGKYINARGLNNSPLGK